MGLTIESLSIGEREGGRRKAAAAKYLPPSKYRNLIIYKNVALTHPMWWNRAQDSQYCLSDSLCLQQPPPQLQWYRFDEKSAHNHLRCTSKLSRRIGPMYLKTTGICEMLWKKLSYSPNCCGTRMEWGSCKKFVWSGWLVHLSATWFCNEKYVPEPSDESDDTAEATVEVYDTTCSHSSSGEMHPPHQN